MGHQLLARIRLTIICFVLTLAVIGGLLLGYYLSAVGVAVSLLDLAAASGAMLSTFAGAVA